ECGGEDPGRKGYEGKGKARVCPCRTQPDNGKSGAFLACKLSLIWAGNDDLFFRACACVCLHSLMEGNGSIRRIGLLLTWLLVGFLFLFLLLLLLLLLVL